MATKKTYVCKSCGKNIVLDQMFFLMAGPKGYEWVKHNDCSKANQHRPKATASERSRFIKDV